MFPVIIISCTGLLHVIFTIFVVRSLMKWDYKTIEIIVKEKWEKEFLCKHLGNISCEIVNVDRGNYGVWAFRPFALEQYNIKHSDRDVVICDTDILWKQDPTPLFNRFYKKNWVHKVTSLNPADLYMNVNEIPKSRIGLITMKNYLNNYSISGYPNFHLNCGLFMLPCDVFPNVLERWVNMIRSIPPEQMIMTEALLSLVYADMKLKPISDRNDIKHLETAIHDPIDKEVIHFDIAEVPDGMFTGYQTAQHYFGTQRNVLFQDVVKIGLDNGDLVKIAKKEILKGKMKNFPQKASKKILNLIKN